MANQEHLAILKQGVEVWNQWRKEYRDIRPDLSDADLIKFNLQFADLSDTNLSSSNLSGADLFFARLSSTNLDKANLSGARLASINFNGVSITYEDKTVYKSHKKYNTLRGANLNNVDLSWADLSEVDLSDSNLRGSDLRVTNFSGAKLDRADLSEAKVLATIFGDIDLQTVKGLETLIHLGPSTIGIDTIIRSYGKIPEIFLRNAGVPVSIIEAIPSLIGSLKPIDFYTCFISYSSKDQDFTERLYADLQSKGVRCWFAPHDLRPGTIILRGIDEAIRMYDKLLLILSRHSVASNWVEHEVEIALFKEIDNGQEVLFPIRLDNAVLESPSEWASRLRHRHIGDFTRWKSHDLYQKAFTRLLRDLKTETLTPP